MCSGYYPLMVNRLATDTHRHTQTIKPFCLAGLPRQNSHAFQAAVVICSRSDACFWLRRPVSSQVERIAEPIPPWRIPVNLKCIFIVSRCNCSIRATNTLESIVVVFPAEAGIQTFCGFWTPAFAGVTMVVSSSII